jgi:pimeloyl-ACP methyl ester carboxylesterase
MRSAVWQPLWEELDGWRHLGLDLPWHGSSRPLRPGEDLAALADGVVAHATAAAVRHVVALSFGTVLATEMALRHPEAFRTWTLAAPSLPGMVHEPAVARRYRDLAELYQQAGAGEHLTRLWMSSPPAIFAGVNERPPTRDRVAALIHRHEWRELAGDGMRRLVDRPRRAADLAAVKAPVLVLIGERDLLTHRACARSLAAALPAASLRVMPGCGHLAPLEEPAAVAGVVREHFGDVRR